MSQVIKFVEVSFLVVLLFASASHSSEYQGFGAETPGGSGQPTYRVTNLETLVPAASVTCVMGYDMSSSILRGRLLFQITFWSEDPT